MHKQVMLWNTIMQTDFNRSRVSRRNYVMLFSLFNMTDTLQSIYFQLNGSTPLYGGLELLYVALHNPGSNGHLKILSFPPISNEIF